MKCLVLWQLTDWLIIWELNCNIQSILHDALKLTTLTYRKWNGESINVTSDRCQLNDIVIRNVSPNIVLRAQCTRQTVACSDRCNYCVYSYISICAIRRGWPMRNAEHLNRSFICSQFDVIHIFHFYFIFFSFSISLDYVTCFEWIQLSRKWISMPAIEFSPDGGDNNIMVYALSHTHTHYLANWQIEHI